MKRYSTILFMIALFSNSCKSNKYTQTKENDNFKLIEASFSNWTAGIPSGGSGVEYYFKIKISTTENIKFDTAWIDNKAFEIYISKETNSITSQPIKYSNGDIITLRVSELKNQNIKPIIMTSPIKHNGVALIGYKINNKRDYLIIKNIEEINSPNRP